MDDYKLLNHYVADFILSALVILAVIYIAAQAFFGTPAIFSKNVAVTIHGHTFNAEVAGTMLSRNKGLSGRPSFAADAAMLFIFNMPSRYGFWMKDMQFPIDIIWIRLGKVIGFSENAAPEPGKNILNLTAYYPPGNIDRVLEVSAGTVQKYGFTVGDSVQIVFGAQNP